jgi:hypothetical protein
MQLQLGQASDAPAQAQVLSAHHSMPRPTGFLAALAATREELLPGQSYTLLRGTGDGRSI